MRPRRLLSYLLHLGLLALTSATLLSCGEIDTNPSPTEPTTSAETEVEKNDDDCEPGVLGCRCLRGDFECWDEDAICIGGICREQTCEVGEENCACFANSTCSQAADGSWLVCGVNGICRTPACPQGAEGCGCFAGYQCNEGLFCQDDGQNPPSCVRPNCPAGDLNCGCFPDRSCGVDATGAQLVCEGNTCTRPQCQQGSDGCACNADFSCDGNLLCSNGTCGAPTCVQGSLSCACAPDGSCNEGLSCDANGTCQAVNCPQGEEGCGCFPDFTCGVDGDSQLLCSAAGRCVRSDCRAGLANCGCAADGSCVEGYQCRNSFCVERPLGESDLLPRETARPELCFSQCKEGYVDRRGEYYPCSNDGLMEAGLPKLVDGAWVDRICDRGSWVLQGVENPLACPNGDLDCPRHQLCYDGFCSSNCETDSECNGDRRCFMHVCRAPCDTASSRCGSGEYCETQDAESGYCMPKVPVEEGAEVVSTVATRFSLNVQRLSFSNTQTVLELIITNHSPNSIRLPIRKHSHRIIRESGQTQVNKEGKILMIDASGEIVSDPPDNEWPLYWVNFSAVDGDTNDAVTDSNEEEIEVNIYDEDYELINNSAELKPNQVKVIIALSDETVGEGEDRQPVLPDGRWSGQLEIGNEVYGRQYVHLSYTRGLSGRWSGEVVYFSDFGVDDVKDVGTAQSPLDAWLQNKAEYPSATKSALLERWHSEIRGSNIGGVQSFDGLNEDRFDAVLTSILERTWKRDGEDGCNDNFCFPYDGDECAEGGLCTLSNTDLVRVPHGVIRYPATINLTPSVDGGFQGRIETNQTLHYAADPNITLAFRNSLTSCIDTAPAGLEPDTCFNPLESFNAQITLGGRYIVDAPKDSDGNLLRSQPVCATGYEAFKFPWFVAGFERQTAYDTREEIRVRYECRSSSYPYPAAGGPGVEAPAVLQINQLLAGINPIPDGRYRSRELLLLDGGLINDDRLFIIFREKFARFLPSQTDDFYAYGYLDLKLSPATLKAEDYVGVDQTLGNSAPDFSIIEDREDPDFGAPTDPNVMLPPQIYPQCSAQLIEELSGIENLSSLDEYFIVNGTPDGARVSRAVQTLINGVAIDFNAAPFAAAPQSGSNPQPAYSPGVISNSRYIHYLCHDTGTIDGCGSEDLVEECPPESSSTFFVLARPTDNGYSVDNGYEFRGDRICDLNCNTDGTCGAFLGISEYLNGEARGSGLSEGAYWLNEHSDSPSLTVPAVACTRDLRIASGVAVPIDPDEDCDPETDGNCTQVLDVRRVECNTNLQDLREGKEFYLTSSDEEARLSDLYASIQDAFRYKTQFRNRNGTNLGFTPTLCDPNNDSIRYCYSPTLIESVRERVDCLQWIYNGGEPTALERTSDKYLSALETRRRQQNDKTLDLLTDFLQFSFGANYFMNAEGNYVRYDGFEKLYAELITMLADEAYTDAFRSRFDLAGIRGAPFRGDLYEYNGERLEGTAGFELFSLYKAVQYYDYALEQFFRQTRTISKIMKDEGDGGDFDGEWSKILNLRTAVDYLSTLVRASSKKSSAWSEIAQRYQDINRYDLALAVLKRGYTSTYVESVMLTRYMLLIFDDLDASKRSQLYDLIQKANIRYQISLWKMREVFEKLSPNPVIFGLDPLYIPFPGLEPNESNAFEKIMVTLRRKLADAGIKEDRALQENRSFETDAAMFQQELAQLENTYESQLGEICGTFEVGGRVYPAIQKYAHLDERLKLLGNPCGLAGNGQIYIAINRVEQLENQYQKSKQVYENNLSNIEGLEDRAKARCDTLSSLANLEINYLNDKSDTEKEIRDAEKLKAEVEANYQAVNDQKLLEKCDKVISTQATTLCYAKEFLKDQALNMARDGLVDSVTDYFTGLSKSFNKLKDLSTNNIRLKQGVECNEVMENARYETSQQLASLNTNQLDFTTSRYDINATLSDIRALYSKAKSLEAEQAEAEQMTIDIEAARNDPNVRIYRNDAVLNADRTFKSALKEAYKATKIFEYYSSSSYEGLDQLLLLRMVSRGEYNLEAYVDELEDAFNEFEEEYGIPDIRVDVVSVRDDILKIPVENATGQSLSQSERVKQFRARITDNSLNDAQGYRVLPFSLRENRLSPLTRNHKIAYIEAEFIGSNVGDSVGRLYLRNNGTSVVKSLEDGAPDIYYRFPRHIAVINTFFNGQKVFTPEIYQNQRLRDRPYLNTRWELILNQMDERANQDIDLNSLTDIKLYVYYRDFTDY